MTDDLICIDANFVVRLVTSKSTNSPFINLWEEWKNKQIQIVAPTLFYYEVANALYRISKAEQMTLEQAKEALTDALNFNIIMYGNLQLPLFHQTAINIANQFNLSASYDAQHP